MSTNVVVRYTTELYALEQENTYLKDRLVDAADLVVLWMRRANEANRRALAAERLLEDLVWEMQNDNRRDG